MLARKQGLIIEITDGDSYMNRGNLFYDLAKISTIRLAESMAFEFRDFSITAVALTPGFLRSEAVLEHFGVIEKNWKDAIPWDKGFAYSESPYYIGKAVVALATDQNVFRKTGKILSSDRLVREYRFTDTDGTQPLWY